MSDLLDSPVLVLTDLDDAGAPAPGALELLTAASHLTGSGVVALALADVGPQARAALAGAGATRLLVADVGQRAALAGVTGDALVAAARAAGVGLVLVPGDYRGREAAAHAAVLLGSAVVADAADLEVADGVLRASRLVLSGSWTTTLAVRPHPGQPPVVAVRPGGAQAASGPLEPVVGARSLDAEPLEPVVGAAGAVSLVSRERAAVAAGPDLGEARTVVVGGRGVDGDFALVRSLAEVLDAAVGATRVACDEGWIERSAQIGQTGVSVAPHLYVGLGVSGAVHHTSGIQGAETIVAVVDDSEAPILEMADYGVVGDVTEVVPQLVDELVRLRG